MPSTAPRRFAGFDRDALDLLRDLEEHIDAQRARFRDLLIEPAIDLVIEMGPLLRAHISPELRAEPRVGDAGARESWLWHDFGNAGSRVVARAGRVTSPRLQ